VRPAEYETLFEAEDAHWWFRAQRRVLHWHLARYLPGWREAALLDAGCGTGGNLAHLPASHRGARVGLDRAPEALGHARRRGLPALVRGEVSQLPFAPASFDAAMSVSVLYHRWVPDPVAALRELHRVLRPGGLLFVDVPAFASLWSEHDVAVMTARRFTAPELRRLLAESGFEVLRATYWASLLFPAVWAARRFRLVAGGRDLEAAQRPGAARGALLDAVMRAEAVLWRRTSLPAGVSLHCVARRRSA
jgi:SAM-dependent methyltransferase